MKNFTDKEIKNLFPRQAKSKKDIDFIIKAKKEIYYSDYYFKFISQHEGVKNGEDFYKMAKKLSFKTVDINIIKTIFYALAGVKSNKPCSMKKVFDTLGKEVMDILLKHKYGFFDYIHDCFILKLKTEEKIEVYERLEEADFFKQ